MYTLSSMPSTTSVVSTYTAFAASAMLARSIVSEVQSMAAQLIPQSIRDHIISKFRFLFGKPSSEMTLIIDEQFDGLCLNEVFAASECYLQDKISPSNDTLRVTKDEDDKELSITVHTGEEIIDSYQGVSLKWVMICTEPRRTNSECEGSEKAEHRSFHLSFFKKHREVIIGSYLPSVIEFAKARKEMNREVKLESLGDGGRRSIVLNHPSTFATLAMDPALKKAIMGDLDRFLERREFYRRVGKAWKRGYLLYGPPGTGKSSLIAAMANHLKFHIYDLDLTGIRDNMSLRNMLLRTENRSIVVIEDIDCSIELQNRHTATGGSRSGGETRVTLSGLLNFIDGLWSSCGDERIIVFTTNYKEKLDPALLRPGRMDMHIHMSYLSPSGFRVLAMNYLGLSTHPLFAQIDDLLVELEVTPATVAEELMRSEGDPNAALESLLHSLQSKKPEVIKSDPQGETKKPEAIKSDPQRERDPIQCKEEIQETKRKARRSTKRRKHGNQRR